MSGCGICEDPDCNTEEHCEVCLELLYQCTCPPEPDDGR